MPPSITELTVKPLPPEEALAFAVAGLARLDQVSALQTALADALEQGETLASFKKRAAAEAEERGDA